MLLLLFFWDYADYSWFCWPLGGTYTHGDLETGTALYSAECVEGVFSEVRVEESRLVPTIPAVVGTEKGRSRRRARARVLAGPSLIWCAGSAR